jgi:hypothetical protein
LDVNECHMINRENTLEHFVVGLSLFQTLSFQWNGYNCALVCVMCLCVSSSRHVRMRMAGGPARSSKEHQ